jgi:type I restriction enzyme, S subunit
MSNKTEEMTMKQGSKRELKPKVRFPEFRNAPGWEYEAMGELYSFKGTNSFSRDQLNYESGTVKNIHYGDIHTKYPSSFDICKEKVPFINPSESLETIRPDNYCVEGDVIFADASEDLEDVGKSIEIVALNDERLLSGMHTILARQKCKILKIGFGGHLFKSARIRNQIKKEAQGAKVFGVSPTRLSNIEICYPPEKAEQQKIATCLTSLDELIDAHGQKLDALKAHKKGLMQQLFPREGETLPRLRFPEFQDAGEWAIRELAEFITERNQYPRESVPLFSLTIEDGITPKTERYERSFLVNDEIDAYKLVLPDDFAYNPMNLRFGAIGRHSGTENVAVSRYYNVFSCDNTVDSRFCETYFKSDGMVAFYDDMAAGSLIEKRRVHFSAFLKFNIRFPELAEQKTIADCLFSLDVLIGAQTQKLDALKTHKKGLMQQLFPSPEEVEA